MAAGNGITMSSTACWSGDIDQSPYNAELQYLILTAHTCSRLERERAPVFYSDLMLFKYTSFQYFAFVRVYDTVYIYIYDVVVGLGMLFLPN